MPDRDSIRVTKFKKEAKSLHKSFQAGEVKAVRRVSPFFNSPKKVTLQQVQLVIARENEFGSWKKLLDNESQGKLLHCNFCGKSQHEVAKLIAGPGVYVCDECVGLCNNILDEEIQEKPKAIELSAEGVELEARSLRLALHKHSGETRFFVRKLE